MACHTRSGYRGLDKLMGARDLDATVGFLKMLRSTNPKENTYIAFMPPFVGTESEGRDLATYLQTLRLPAGPPANARLFLTPPPLSLPPPTPLSRPPSPSHPL